MRMPRDLLCAGNGFYWHLLAVASASGLNDHQRCIFQLPTREFAVQGRGGWEVGEGQRHRHGATVLK
jgi:hypothetical protein